MQILFLTRDQYKPDFEIGTFNHKKRFINCATKANFEVFVTSWNNIIIKNGQTYIKRGIGIKDSKEQQIKTLKKIHPVYINNHVSKGDNHITANQHNLDVLNYLLKEQLTINSDIDDDSATNIYVLHLIKKIWQKSYYSYHYEMAKMGKWYLEKYFKIAENHRIKTSRPKTLVATRDQMITEIEKIFDEQKNSNLIVKPHSATCSKGIYILTPQNFRQQLEQLQNDPENFFVCQEYLAGTILYKNKKADTRIHVAVLSWDPLVIKIYKKGWLRMSNKDFSSGKIEDPEQSLSSDSIAYRNGGGKHFVTISQYFQESFRETETQLWRKIKNEIENAIKAITVGGDFLSKNLQQTIHFLGFDIMFKKEKNSSTPYILEINYFPDLYRDKDKDPEDKANTLLDGEFIKFFQDLKKHISSLV